MHEARLEFGLRMVENGVRMKEGGFGWRGSGGG